VAVCSKGGWSRTKESDKFVDYLSLNVDKEAGAKDILLGRPTKVYSTKSMGTSWSIWSIC
jgi:hypothetical protein